MHCLAKPRAQRAAKLTRQCAKQIRYINNMNAPTTALPVRKLNLDLSQGFGRHWHGGDAFRTAYYNALSMSFPVGEQFFIDAVQSCAKLLPHTAEHAALHAQLRDFSAQEATHRHVHAQYNAVLEKQGLLNHWAARASKRIAQHAHLNPRHHLAMTAAYEHYTGVFASVLLQHPQMLQGAEPALRSVWLWHCMEETEHKAVAFDLYQAVSGSHYWRVRWFLIVSLVFASDVLRQTTTNLWHDGTLFKPSTWWSAACFFLGRPSKGNGWVWLSALQVAGYLRKRFHPWQHNNQGQAAVYAQAHAGEWRVLR